MGGALVQSARIRAAPQTTIGRPVGRSLRKRGPQRKRGPRQSPRGIAHHRHGISRSPRRICGAAYAGHAGVRHRFCFLGWAGVGVAGRGWACVQIDTWCKWVFCMYTGIHVQTHSSTHKHTHTVQAHEQAGTFAERSCSPRDVDLEGFMVRVVEGGLGFRV